ncbi:MAG: hypothetical protein OXH90_09910 [Paracoccaceae bacterium]|nr:hypothetical protein [Paracoccaceae bacterium]MDE2917675.1 hypothetical protein [Paracoccaceae bacterium]
MRQQTITNTQSSDKNKQENQKKGTSSSNENKMIIEEVHRKAEAIVEALFKGK